MKQTFIHDFGNGIKCSTTVNFTRIFNGKSPVVNCIWDRKPTPAEYPDIIQAYHDWMTAIVQAGVDQTKKSILYVFEPIKGVFVPYLFKPNEPPTNVTR